MVTNNSDFLNKLTNLDKIKESIKAPLNKKRNIVVFGDRYYTENIINQLLANLPELRENIYQCKIDMYSFKTTKSLFVFPDTTVCNKFAHEDEVISVLRHPKNKVNLVEIVYYPIFYNNENILTEITKQPLFETLKVYTDWFICSKWWAGELLRIYPEIKRKMFFLECDNFYSFHISHYESISCRFFRFINRENW